MDQMRLPATIQGEGRVCAKRDGANPQARVVVAAWPTNAAESAEAAALISIAKGWDGQPAPARTTWLCLAKADAALPDGERAPGVAVSAKDLEGIDYRVLRDQVQARFKELNQ
jgi:hypothetical protein